MKRYLAVLCSVFIFTLSSLSYGGTYKEGVNYIRLGEEAFEANNSVIEMYTTNCPHCYQYEKSVIPSYAEKLTSAGVEFDCYHVSSKPPFGEEKTNVLAVTRALNEEKLEPVKMAYFKRLHDEKLKFKSADEAIEYGLKVAGISREKFEQTLPSDPVKALLNQWVRADQVARIQGVPAIVVNGKYLIVTKSVRSMDMLDDLTQELLEM